MILQCSKPIHSEDSTGFCNKIRRAHAILARSKCIISLSVDLPLSAGKIKIGVSVCYSFKT